MIKKRIILSFTIVGLFLVLAIIPNVSAGNFRKLASRTLEIAYKDKNGELFYKTIVVSEGQIQIFMDCWSEWENSLKQIRENEEFNNQEMIKFESITVNLLEEFKKITQDKSSGQYLFPPINISRFVHNFLFTFGLGAKIFSIGRGRAWLPFNRQGETFVGKRYLPIIIRHQIGFTRIKFWSLMPLSRIISSRMFKHTSFIMGFTGLYINIGKRNINRPAGPIIVIGRINLVSISDDII